jgi:hypothetical protein
MAVTDEQVAALRAQLAGDLEEHHRLFTQLTPSDVRSGYRALASAAFCVAAERRFPNGSTAADVIEYVGDVRGRTQAAAQMDPRTAERVILAVVTDEPLEDVDPRTSFEIQLLLLAAMTADAQLDAAGLDAFLVEARKLADQWLA